MAKEKVWAADDAKYREYCDRIISLKDVQKDLGKEISELKGEAASAGCNPKVLNQMVRLAMMKQDDKTALEEALEK